MSKTALLMAAGTGGHVFPALAVANLLRQQNIQVQWLGTPHGIENKIIPDHHIPLHHITIAGVRGKGLSALVKAPWRMTHALWQARQLVKQLNPDVVLGMGGFVSGPGGVAAWMAGKPLIIHEQNSIAGLTNRWLSRVATRVLQAFPGSFPEGTVAQTVGNPVRSPITQLLSPAERFQQRSAKQPLRLLVFGGSQGANVMNQALTQALCNTHLADQLDIWHQTGERSLAETQAAYAALPGVRANVTAFIDDMAAAYEWADIVLCRAGALTVSELMCVGLGSILVPYPHAFDNHQLHNAKQLEKNRAGIILPQPQLTAKMLQVTLLALAADRQKVRDMAVAAYSTTQQDAANQVAEHCMQLISSEAP